MKAIRFLLVALLAVSCTRGVSRIHTRPLPRPNPTALIVPNLEAGNMLAKQLSFLAGADGAGVVLGARLPIILTSRADSVRSRLASCVTAALVARGRSTPGAD